MQPVRRTSTRSARPPFVHGPVQRGDDLLVALAAQAGADEQMMGEPVQVLSPFLRPLPHVIDPHRPATP